MNCPKCGTVINSETNFCSNCGEPLNNQHQQSNFNQYQDYHTTESLNNISINTQNSFANSTLLDDEELIDVYIGKSVEKIKKGGFSLNAFIASGLYLLYRKLWLAFIAWFVISYFIPTKMISMVSIIFGCCFNKFYLSYVKNQVKKIKEANPNKSQNELVSICAKKGGTSILALFGGIGLIIILGFMVALLSGRSQTVSLGDLTVNIPGNFGASVNNDILDYMNSYGINTEDNCCVVSLYKNDSTKYNSISNYLNNGISKKSNDALVNYKTETINGITWNSVTAKNLERTSYHYVAIKGLYIYEVEFEIYKDDGVCSEALSTVVESIKLK